VTTDYQNLLDCAKTVTVCRCCLPELQLFPW